MVSASSCHDPAVEKAYRALIANRANVAGRLFFFIIFKKSR
jgi:hypothetical protein